jgi:RHS repeat-associated protein
MGKVTAVGMDVITEKSGHVSSPIAPSVCTTPAAPAPIPVPYPAVGTSKEGIAGAPNRTKINGAPIGTVGGAFKASHGNEPGTMKDVVSLNTGGAVSIVAGAPTVICEIGMMGITGSPILANKGPGSSPRTAPAPMLAAPPGVAAGVATLGGDAGGGGEDGAGGGGGAGGGAGAGGDGKHAPGNQPGQCSGGHPVDVVTGRAYTLPAVDLELAGPLPLVFSRVYSTAAASRDVGLGFGWAHSWGWELEVRRRAIIVWSEEGIPVEFPPLEIGAEVIGPWGWRLRRHRERYELDACDDLRRVFAAVDASARRWVLVVLRDRNENRIEIDYDEEAHLSGVVDSAGRTVRVLRSREGRIARVQVYNARARGQWVDVARFAYDKRGNLVTAIDAEGHASRFQYDDDHRITCETDRSGLSFRFVYDHAGRCVETWGEVPNGRDPSLAEDVPEALSDGTPAKGIHHVRLDYHPHGYTEVSDSTHVRRYFGNNHGLVDKKIVSGGVEEAIYDDRGFVLAERDGESAVTRYARDARGRVLRQTDPLGRGTAYERDGNGLPIKIVDPAGGVTEIQRDGRGNLLHEADPTGAAWSFTYNAHGLVTSITSPTGGVTRYTYDPEGNCTERTDPNGARWQWAYDVLGRRTRVIDPRGHETRYSWTDRGDLAAVFDAAGGVTRYTYDGERRIAEIHGPGQRTVALAWAGFGRLVQETTPTGDVVRFRYNREGELLEVHNERGEIHRLVRDVAGRLVGERTFDGRELRYRLDGCGRPIRITSGGQQTDLSYNEAGELTARTLDDESVESFEYNARGELLHATWPGGEVRFARDAAGRIVNETQSFGGQIHAIESAYDRSGARVLRTTSRGHVERVERDTMGARARTILDEQHDVHHARDELGRETMRSLPRGGRLHHVFDPLGRAARRWTTAPSELRPVRPGDPGWTDAAAPAQPDRVTVEHEYRYNEEGELSDALDRRRGWTLYDYDPAGRLLSVVREATGHAERFRYDPTSNHYTDDEARLYGPGGRLLRRGETIYTWDAAGRLVEKTTGADVWRYSWDAAGHLAAVDRPDGRRAEYGYDPLGRRFEARLYDAAPPLGRARLLLERTRFVWDGDTIAHSIRSRAAAEGDPVVDERTYCFEDGGFVPWAHCEAVPDGYGGQRRTWAYYVNDPIGTPDELVDGSGAVLTELDRRAWGRTEETPGARASTPLRFQGQIEDPETGLFYNRFRYYDPEAGLYLSPDPIGLEGGIHAFAYGTNPTGWVDPFGLARGVPEEHDIMPYGAQPSGRKAAGVEAHHIIQNEWAQNNVSGYTKKGGPSILLTDKNHDTITARQNARRNARECAGLGKWSSNMREEFNHAHDDLAAAGVPEKKKRKALKDAYKHFYK